MIRSIENAIRLAAATALAGGCDLDILLTHVSALIVAEHAVYSAESKNDETFVYPKPVDEDAGLQVLPEVATVVPCVVAEVSRDADLEKRRARRKRQRANRKANKLKEKLSTVSSVRDYQAERIDLERQRTEAYIASLTPAARRLDLEAQRTDAYVKVREAAAQRTYAQVAKSNMVSVVSTSSSGSTRLSIKRSVSASEASEMSITPSQSASQQSPNSDSEPTTVSVVVEKIADLPDDFTVVKKLAFSVLGDKVARYNHKGVEGYVIPDNLVFICGCETVNLDGEYLCFVPGHLVQADDYAYGKLHRGTWFTDDYEYANRRYADLVGGIEY